MVYPLYKIRRFSPFITVPGSPPIKNRGLASYIPAIKNTPVALDQERILIETISFPTRADGLSTDASRLDAIVMSGRIPVS